MLSRPVFSALAFSSLALPAFAQVITVSGSPISTGVVVFDEVSFGEDPMMVQEGEVAVPDASTPSAAPAAKKKPTPRQEKLAKLDYDRRPSTTLKAWSTPPKPPAEPKKDEAQPAEAAPAPAAEPSAAPTDPEAAKKAAEEAAKAKKAAEEAAKKAAEAKAIDAEMEQLKRNVTLGDWPAVKAYFTALTPEEQKAGFAKMLESLQRGPQDRPNVPQQGQPYIEKNRFEASDVLGLVHVMSIEIEKAELAKLGAILRLALDQGAQLDVFLALVKKDLGAPGYPLDARKLARVLSAANELVAMGEFLPSPEEAEQKNDREGLNLLARHFLAQNGKERKIEWLEKAWKATQAALAAGEISDDDKTEALRRAVDIAPKIQKELGQAWLDESFTSRPERGMEILSAIGSSASMALAQQPMQADARLDWLKLQTTATKALLRAAPERAESWKRTLSLLASNWLKEAQFTYQWDTSTGMRSRVQRDRFGNTFYWDPDSWNRGNMPSPIKTGEILEARPDDAWLAHVDEALRPKFDVVFAQLYLKVSEEKLAFPYIESLAARHGKQAKELVDEFLRVWAKNHNPNQAQQNNPYMYMYGFDERANGIPLTRSKQERNLVELGTWIERLRKLPVELDQNLVSQAFTAAHSSAEIYRIDTIEQVFGPMKDLEPATLAALVQAMRQNLLTIWRDPAEQEKSKTKRKQKDIEAEVLAGYSLANEAVRKALVDHPKSWELLLVRGALAHDENNYRWTLKKDPEFSQRRAAAFELFHAAANAYLAVAPTLDVEKETTQVFDTWFYAALGASDLGAITHEQTLAAAEIPQIREAFALLPGEKSKRHLDMFASALFTRMGSAKPAVKFRYVREGLAITGDNDLAREARDVYDYYKDLVTEIRLEAKIDGADKVGHGAPFGLQVNLRHTAEIERESGGFGKYLQNQNAMAFSYNYGRPEEDYRDKFEEAARAALSEQFEVLSVTFNQPAVRSIASETFGWRVTPYAYILLKPKGPQVDRVPPLRLDLDFLDTSGYAVLPIESAVLPIDATPDAGDERPFRNLKVVQTLDERQAKDGKLLLEVKATALGIPPSLDAFLDLPATGFDVVKKDDPGAAAVKFDEEEDTRAVVCERIVTLTLKAKEGAPRPDSFAFGKPKVETAGSEHFRYVDADLASVGDVVELERQYGKPSRAWMWAIPAVAIGLFATLWLVRRKRTDAATAEARYRVPDEVTPFTVIGLLREIEREDAIAPKEKRELAAEIARLERHFFASADGEAPDLEHVARTWAGKAG
ncbi:MAG: hypothetical protein IPJ77_14525 [Planctomycetes bacterium]|nr:hypothetical protein [Planctomycetota bacterium]